MNPVEVIAKVLGDEFGEFTTYADTAKFILSALSSAGYVIAPKEPTSAQLSAGQKAWLSDPLKLSSTLYRAMIEAGRGE